MQAMDPSYFEQFQQELAELDKEMVEVEGKMLRPSQCYHVGIDPAHILFNTNCPIALKDKINAILARYRFR